MNVVKFEKQVQLTASNCGLNVPEPVPGCQPGWCLPGRHRRRTLVAFHAIRTVRFHAAGSCGGALGGSLEHVTACFRPRAGLLTYNYLIETQTLRACWVKIYIRFALQFTLQLLSRFSVHILYIQSAFRAPTWSTTNPNPSVTTALRYQSQLTNSSALGFGLSYTQPFSSDLPVRTLTQGCFLGLATTLLAAKL